MYYICILLIHKYYQMDQLDQTTEEKIIEAAHKIFAQKGYAAARNRDIADEAGLNTALVNYYFRSKQKLFEIVMEESLSKFFSVMPPILNNNKTSVYEKIEQLVDRYIDMLLDNPDLPLFVFNEIKTGTEEFKRKLQIKTLVLDSLFLTQLSEVNKNEDPIQFFISLLGMILFPFVSKPIFYADDSEFENQMKSRKRHIKIWTEYILRE